MNCQNFEKSIDDLARDQMMDAATREAAASHAEACARCAARLADERALTAGLRAVARLTEVEQAPERVEAALLAAFSERKAASLAEVAAPVTARRPALRRRAPGWALAAAAAVLLIVALVFARFERTPPPAELANRAEPAPPAQTTPESKSPLAQGDAARGDDRKEQSLSVSNKPTRARRTSRRDGRRSVIANKSRDNATGIDSHSNRDTAEITTEFLPLVSGSNLAPLDGGHLVRVELPRSALVSFGLPMNENRADERIKADVLFGNDGVARAVRFVQ
jgi:hypothetical protein